MKNEQYWLTETKLKETKIKILKENEIFYYHYKLKEAKDNGSTN